MATSTPAKKAEKSARRTAAQIAQDELDLTLDKLKKAETRVVRLQTELASAEQSVVSLTSLADYQHSHPALTAHPSGQDSLSEAPDTI